MRIHSFLFRAALAGLPLAAAIGGTAHAQFVGDAFFVDPSVAVMPGAEGAIQVAVFSGTAPVGAVRAAVTYDPAALEIIGIDPVTTGRVTPAVQWRRQDEVLHIVMVNGASLTRPIGTVPLASIRFKALGAINEKTVLTTKAIEILQPDATTIAPGTETYVGEVSFVAPTMPSTSRLAAEVTAATNPDMVARARRMRPAGGVVTLQVVDGSGQARPVQVQIPASAAPRE